MTLVDPMTRPLPWHNKRQEVMNTIVLAMQDGKVAADLMLQGKCDEALRRLRTAEGTLAQARLRILELKDMEGA